MKFSFEGGASATKAKGLVAILAPITIKGKNAELGHLLSCQKEDKKEVQDLIKSGHLRIGEPKLLKSRSGKSFLFVQSREKWSEKDFYLFVRNFVRLAKAEGFKNIGICLDDFPFLKSRAAHLLSENALLAHFDFSEEFKSKPKKGWKRVQKVSVFSKEDKKGITPFLKEGELFGKWTNRSRILCNYPPSHLKPTGLAEAALTIADELTSIEVDIFDEKKLKAEGMNAILAVGQGSSSPPRMIILKYFGAQKNEPPIALIGKGITFDSGGLNTKGNHMDDMHMDMSGAAGVMCAIALIAELKLPVNVVGVIPAAENMPSGISYRQGDIIRAFGGKTIEVGNTDAEGRVVMADAIEYAKSKSPKAIITLATLTGTSMQALGLRMSALFVKNNVALQNRLQEIGRASGDFVWPLPLIEESEADVKGNFADVVNTSKDNTRYGWAILGAAFLYEFAKPFAFAHIDMAPRMKTLPKEDYLAPGSAGFGVRFFAILAKSWSEVRGLI